MLTEQIRPFRFALVAFAPVRLSVLNHKKTSADISGSLFAIVDERISEACEKNLCKEGFEIIKLPRDERLGSAVCSHTDILLFSHQNTLIASRQYIDAHEDVKEALYRAIPSLDLRLSDEEISHKYPLDAIFNAKAVKNKLFAKSDSVSKKILNYAKEKNLGIVSVKQGYVACTTLFVGEEFAITSDDGMARALRAEGMDVLKIHESEKIKLPPYRNGFIGGTAGIFGNTVYFLGNLNSHPEGKDIELNLLKRGYRAVSLDTNADSLFDLGGIILTECADADC